MTEKVERKSQEEVNVEQSLLDAHYDAVDEAAARGPQGPGFSNTVRSDARATVSRAVTGEASELAPDAAPDEGGDGEKAADAPATKERRRSENKGA